MRQFWVGGILLSTALSGAAITLGPQTGAGVLGRPLDIQVQAILAPGEAVADVCVSAEVLYGESKLAPGAVRATLQRATPDAPVSVRVQASPAIDEPVVTVVVRAGCTASFTRRYVLLVDPTQGPVALRGPIPSTPPNQATAKVPDSTGPAQPNAPSSARVPIRPPAAAPSRANRVARKPVPAPPAPASTATATATATAPRLEMDAIDLGLAIERDPVLKLSLSLLNEPGLSQDTQDGQDARAAAGRLWKAINASPEDILRDTTRLQALSEEVGALRAAQTSHQATVSGLTSRLEASQTWQWLAYVLGFLLALVLVALLWLLRQQKNRAGSVDRKAWWSQEKTLDSESHNTMTRRGTAGPSSAAPHDRTGVPNSRFSKEHPRSRLTEQNDSRSLNFKDSTPVAFATDLAEFASSQSASRSVATEELFDVQQQADFFISLGEDEKAIKLLRDHIAESQVPSALTHLDLLKIYHRQGREEEYERLRIDFNRLFNAGAPAFAHFSDEGRGLEFYERALGRIQALWPEPRVLDVIEESIFREASGPESEVFDLEAYRELLLLYAMAKEMIQRKAVDSKLPRDFEHTKAQALKATAQHGAAKPTSDTASGNPPPTVQRPPVSPNLGLDVNLDDLFAPAAFKASLPNGGVSAAPAAQATDQKGIRGTRSNTTDLETLDFTPPHEGAAPTKRVDKKD